MDRDTLRREFYKYKKELGRSFYVIRRAIFYYNPKSFFNECHDLGQLKAKIRGEFRVETSKLLKRPRMGPVAIAKLAAWCGVEYSPPTKIYSPQKIAAAKKILEKSGYTVTKNK